MSSSPIDYRRPSRPRRGVPSRIPKPQFNIDATYHAGTAPCPSGLDDSAPSLPPSTPRPLTKLDAAFTAAVDASCDASWLIAAGACGHGSDTTDSLLEEAEWCECEDDGRSLHSHYDDDSDLDEDNDGFNGVGCSGNSDEMESRGSWSPAAGEEGRAAGLWGPRAVLEAVAGRLGRWTWTAEWVAALRAMQPHATLCTPPAAAPPAAPSGGSGGSCRSLSAAFERAASEPAAFHTSAAQEDGSNEDFASACSASVAGSSEPSEADSEELHASLGTSVNAADTSVSEWLSGGAWDSHL